jgi:hypothetical protein
MYAPARGDLVYRGLTMLRPRPAALLALLVALTTACGSSGGGTGGTSAGGGTSASTGTGAATGTGGANTGGAGTGGAGTSSSGTGGVGTGGMGTGGAGGGAPVMGYGALAGACGEIDLDDIVSPAPEILANALDFTTYPAFDVSALSPGGQTMYQKGNLGGNSLYSEIFAYEVLYRCDGAALLKTEAEIAYAVQGKKTDILVEIDGAKVGVSVVRAESYPKGSAYPVSQAFDVLQGKLADILQSSANVAPEDAWGKQILAVLAQTPEHADAIQQAYAMVDAATKSDTIVLVTVTEGDDDFIYY